MSYTLLSNFARALGSLGGSYRLSSLKSSSTAAELAALSLSGYVDSSSVNGLIAEACVGDACCLCDSVHIGVLLLLDLSAVGDVICLCDSVHIRALPFLDLLAIDGACCLCDSVHIGALPFLFTILFNENTLELIELLDPPPIEVW